MSTVKPVIVLIEDSEKFQYIITDLLHGIYPEASVVTAANFMEGQKAIARTRPNLVLLDLHLQDGDGIDLLRQLPKESRDFPVMVITGDRSNELLEAALKCGADDFLTKPVDKEIFKSKVLSLVNEKYISQFEFFGDPKGMGAFNTRVPIKLLSATEAALILTSPVLIQKNATVMVEIDGLRIKTTVHACLRIGGGGSAAPSAGPAHYQIAAAVDEAISGQEQLALRRWIFERRKLV